MRVKQSLGNFSDHRYINVRVSTRRFQSSTFKPGLVALDLGYDTLLRACLSYSPFREWKYIPIPAKQIRVSYMHREIKYTLNFQQSAAELLSKALIRGSHGTHSNVLLSQVFAM